VREKITPLIQQGSPLRERRDEGQGRTMEVNGWRRRKRRDFFDVGGRRVRKRWS